MEGGGGGEKERGTDRRTDRVRESGERGERERETGMGKG